MRTQAVGIKAQLLALSEGNVLVRTARKFELLIAQILFELSQKNVRGEICLPPPPDKIGLKRGGDGN